MLFFAPSTETKKARKATRQVDEKPKPTLDAGRTARKNMLSFIFIIVTRLKSFVAFCREIQKMWARTQKVFESHVYKKSVAC